MSKPTSETFTPFAYKPGIGNFPRFGGVDRQSNPGAIAPNRFYDLRNARILGNEIISRPGRVKENTTAMTGAVMGFFDAGDLSVDYNPKIYFGDNFWNPDQSPTTQEGGYGSQWTIVNERVFSPDGSTPTLFTTYLNFSGSSDISQRTEIADLSSITSTNLLISAQQVEDKIFFIWGDAGTNPVKIYIYDIPSGVFTLSDNPGSSVGYALFSTAQFNSTHIFQSRFAVIGDDVYYGALNASGTIATIRKYTATTKSWSTLGTVTGLAQGMTCCLTAYSGHLYLFGINAGRTLISIYKINSSSGSVSTAHTISVTSGSISDVCIFGGNLYFTYQQQHTTTPDYYLGKYDGSSWTDVEATIVSNLGTPTAVMYLVPSANTLYALVGVSNDMRIYGSDLFTTSSFSLIDTAVTAGVTNLSRPVLI